MTRPFRRFANVAYSTARRIVVSVIGATLLAVGIVMLVVPGPGIVTIALGLGVLALEFAWARRWLRRLRSTARSAVDHVRGGGRGGGGNDVAPTGPERGESDRT